MASFIQPKVTVEQVTDNVSRITVEPLERGFGDTLGNSMRRVLLSSLEGAAVESIKIDGIQHEFSTIEGVYEDVTDIVLNCKKLVFEQVGPVEEATATINMKGPATVKGGDFMVPAGFKLVNPDLEICHLGKGAHLVMEMNIGIGRGYLAGQDRDRKGQPIGIINIDSLYSPIVRCAKNVQPCRVGQHTDYDSLRLEIETNGSITPVDAVVQAANIINQHMVAFMNLDKQEAEAAQAESIFGEEEDGEAAAAMEDMVVEDLGFSVRSYNCLKRAEINTLSQLLTYSQDELKNLRNFGEKSVEEVIDKLNEMGYSLK